MIIVWIEGNLIQSMNGRCMLICFTEGLFYGFPIDMNDFEYSCVSSYWGFESDNTHRNQAHTKDVSSYWGFASDNIHRNQAHTKDAYDIGYDSNLQRCHTLRMQFKTKVHIFGRTSVNVFGNLCLWQFTLTNYDKNATLQTKTDDYGLSRWNITIFHLS